ncbi:MAG TPA: hypothetical protein GX738_08125 [Firmicutes bacterium]|jgi:hypothetical protein|nr:hypothetical protein [Bacillota bacterium]
MANQYDDNLPVTPERRDELLNKVVDIIARYELFTPAAFFFSMGKPLAFVGSQLMFFFAPIAGAFVNEATIEEYAHLLSDRSNIERLLDMMEEREFEMRKKKKKES